MEQWGNNHSLGKLKSRRKTCPSVTLPATSPHMDLPAIEGVRDEKPANDYYYRYLLVIFFNSTHMKCTIHIYIYIHIYIHIYIYI